MKAFSCGDVVPGCNARFICSNEDEILAQVARHANEAHGMTEVPDTVAGKVLASITSVPDRRR